MCGKICCFAGHSKIYADDDFKLRLSAKCEELINNNDVGTFWVGNYGEFDALAVSVIGELKSKYPHVELDLILPYVTKSINDDREIYYKKYDCIITADMPESTPAKYRILKCNQYMVDKADFLIACVRYSFGGAAKTLEYAKRNKNMVIFNLREE